MNSCFRCFMNWSSNFVQRGRHHAQHRTIRDGITAQMAAAQIRNRQAAPDRPIVSTTCFPAFGVYRFESPFT